GLVRGNDFVCPEKRRRSHLLVLRKLRGDLLQVALAEAHATYLDLAVRRDQENGRNIGQPVSIGRGLPCAVQQRGERHAVFPVELFRDRGIILRDAEHRGALPRVALVQALQKWNRELTYRAGDLEKHHNGGPALQQLVQRVLFAVQRLQGKTRRRMSRFNVRQGSLQANEPRKPFQKCHRFILPHHGGIGFSELSWSSAACNPSADTAPGCTAW